MAWTYGPGPHGLGTLALYGTERIFKSNPPEPYLVYTLFQEHICYMFLEKARRESTRKQNKINQYNNMVMLVSYRVWTLG